MLKLSLKNSLLSALAVAMGIGFQACNSEPTPVDPIYIVDLENLNTLSFNEAGYWDGCYSVFGDFQADNILFGHQAWLIEYAGVTYPNWKGFCPSKVNDNADYSASGDWVAHQWGCITANPNNGVFLVGNSEATVDADPIENTNCSIRMADGRAFRPQCAYVTNSSYAYYVAKNGSAFSEPIKSTDNFVLNVVGVRNGVMTGHQKYALMADGQLLDQWALIFLDGLGVVDEVLFYIDSTMKNEYGLTVPSYFCIANFGFDFPPTTPVPAGN